MSASPERQTRLVLSVTRLLACLLCPGHGFKCVARASLSFHVSSFFHRPLVLLVGPIQVAHAQMLVLRCLMPREEREDTNPPASPGVFIPSVEPCGIQRVISIGTGPRCGAVLSVGPRLVESVQHQGLFRPSCRSQTGWLAFSSGQQAIPCAALKTRRVLAWRYLALQVHFLFFLLWG